MKGCEVSGQLTRVPGARLLALSTMELGAEDDFSVEMEYVGSVHTTD